MTGIYKTTGECLSQAALVLQSRKIDPAINAYSLYIGMVGLTSYFLHSQIPGYLLDI